MRYQSFDSELAFKDRLKRLCPGKIDIGAVYDFEPRKKASLGNPLVPQSRELVFDIDLTDYDDVRTCCE
ncbi:primase, DNA, polypeptide 1 (49kDa) [Massospora cicadina]|nr:primase, DNA, polypeptide 1 (49kDa) [Massospora cicadina]